MSFLIEERDIILIKYYILFLITYYSQLIFIPDYQFTVVAKNLALTSPITHKFFLFFGSKIVFFFFTKIQSPFGLG